MGGDLGFNNDSLIQGATDDTQIGNILDRLKVVNKPDKTGTTVEYVGAVGVTSTPIPGSDDKFIDQISIRCAVDQSSARRLEFSFDDTNWSRLKVGEAREEEPRGTIKHVNIRAAGSGVTTVNYEIIINFGEES